MKFLKIDGKMNIEDDNEVFTEQKVDIRIPLYHIEYIIQFNNQSHIAVRLKSNKVINIYDVESKRIMGDHI
jgi:hypothetical protein